MFGKAIRAARYITVWDIVRIDKSKFEVVAVTTYHDTTDITLLLVNVRTRMEMTVTVAHDYPFTVTRKK